MVYIYICVWFVFSFIFKKWYGIAEEFNAVWSGLLFLKYLPSLPLNICYEWSIWLTLSFCHRKQMTAITHLQTMKSSMVMKVYIYIFVFIGVICCWLLCPSSNKCFSVEKFNFKIITDPADLMKFVQHLRESNRKVSRGTDQCYTSLKISCHAVYFWIDMDILI